MQAIAYNGKGLTASEVQKLIQFLTIEIESERELIVDCDECADYQESANHQGQVVAYEHCVSLLTDGVVV